MPPRTRVELMSQVAELEERCESLIETVEKQQGQLSLALTVLASLDFELSDFADMLS